MVTKLIITPLLFLILFLGCSESTDTIEGPKFEQKYIFHIAYYNAALRDYKGLYINSQGEVFQYSLDSWPENYQNGNFLEQELELIFQSNAIFLETIDLSLLLQNKELIQLASQSNLSEAISICRDSGYYKYSGFLHNSLTGIYSEIIVYETGDWQAVNTNQNASLLRDLLIEVALEHQIASPVSNCTGIYEG